MREAREPANGLTVLPEAGPGELSQWTHVKASASTSTGAETVRHPGPLRLLALLASFP